jgi:hypothetical protein
MFELGPIFIQGMKIPPYGRDRAMACHWFKHHGDGTLSDLPY